jgi:hypothetical protein
MLTPSPLAMVYSYEAVLGPKESSYVDERDLYAFLHNRYHLSLYAMTYNEPFNVIVRKINGV